MLFVAGVTMAVLGAGFAGQTALAGQIGGTAAGQRAAAVRTIQGDFVRVIPPFAPDQASDEYAYQVVVQVRGRRIVAVAGAWGHCNNIRCGPASKGLSMWDDTAFALNAQIARQLRAGGLDIDALAYDGGQGPIDQAMVDAYKKSLRSAVARIS
ncbi:hypothetical protein GCM10009557_02200 [Virgisporangium ochraceum]|jgi:hypothetical protein|uniref:Uncharacterized protein n=2 Tax=Virgisporangium ochraceum TaxID=65505 RepID=A0A8J4A2V9_9ACTN|nr:hypothetical protein Voc01_077720 [Virgisporangium ochraceum]